MSTVPDRRRRILEAALRCFEVRGVEATTIDEIRRASGASTGSLYHHFGSKEALAGALYLEGLRDYHESPADRLEGLEDPERVVREIVLHYADWVGAHPAWARYLLEMRRAASVRAVDREIRALTRRYLARLAEHLDPFVRRGRLAKLSVELTAAVLLGPSQSLAASWLPQGRLAELRAAAPLLAEVAWRAVARPLDDLTPGRRSR